MNELKKLAFDVLAHLVASGIAAFMGWKLIVCAVAVSGVLVVLMRWRLKRKAEMEAPSSGFRIAFVIIYGAFALCSGIAMWGIGVVAGYLPCHTFEGCVVDGEKRFVAGVTVLAYEEGDAVPLWTTTDTLGFFRFSGLKLKPYRFVILRDDGTTVSLSEFQRNFVNPKQDRERCEFPRRVYEVRERRRILFDTGKSALDPVATQRISDAKRVLAGSERIVVFGHADETGGRERNEPLSRKRATTVVSALTAEDLRLTGFICAGFGSERPQERGNSAQELAANRRVEILALSELAPAKAAPAEQTRPIELRH